MLLNSCGICRMCVKETRVMLSLFDEDNLWKKIQSIADVDIKEGDDLPQQICMECAKDAINADATKWRCERADRILRQAITENDQDDVNDDNVDVATGCDNLKTNNSLPDNNNDNDEDEKILSTIMNYPEDSQEDSHDDDDSQCGTIGLVIEVDSNTSLSHDDDRHDGVQKFTSSPQNTFEENALDSAGDIKHADGMDFKSVSPAFVDKFNSTELPTGAPFHELDNKLNDRTSFKCQHCKTIFISKYFLDTHKCIGGHCKPTDTPICSNCNQVFPSNRHLASHKRFKHCLNKEIDQNASIRSNVHFKMESTLPPTCSNCKQVFHSNQKLASHKRFQHCFREMNQNMSDQFESNSKQEFPSCTNCKKVFKTKRHLAAHKRFKHCLNKEIDPNSKPIDTSDQITETTWKSEGTNIKRSSRKRKFVDEETYRKAVDLTGKGTPVRMWPELIDVCVSTAFYLRRRIRSGEQFHFRKAKVDPNCKILRAVDVTLKQDEDMDKSSIMKTKLPQDENYLPTSETTRSSFSAGV